MPGVALLKVRSISLAYPTVSIPLGIHTLAAELDAAGIEVAAVADLQVVRPERARATLDAIAAGAPDLVGLSAASHDVGLASDVARYFKRVLPRAAVVVGGPAATADATGVLRDCAADYAVAGEGDETFPALVRGLAAGDDVRALPGLAYRDGATVHANPPRVIGAALDDLPFPAWDRVDFRRYGKFISQTMHRSPYAAVVTSRGCPYRCIFCNNVFGRKFRARSPENVLAEWRLLRRRHGIRRIEIMDDIFNWDTGRAHEILRRMHEELPDMRVGFGNGVRADRMDEPFVRLLAATKCYYIAIPIETASPRLQQVTRKHVDFDQVDRVLAWLRKYKVYAVGYFLIALPTETPDEMDATFRYAARPEFSFCGISSASPYPGTALRTMVDREIPASDLGDPDGVYDADAAPAELLKRRKHAILMNQIRRPENWFVLSNLFSWILWWHGVRGLIRYLACIARDALGGKNAVWADRHARDDRARVAATLRDSLA